MDVLDAADQQNKDKNIKPKEKGPIRQGPRISLVDPNEISSIIDEINNTDDNKKKDKKKGSNLASILDEVDDEDDDDVAQSFLGINRKMVKTAREPKPPKDYVDSTVDVHDAQNKQRKNKEKK
eukprot:175075_1